MSEILMFPFSSFQILALAVASYSKEVIVSIQNENKTQYHNADFANSMFRDPF